MRVGNRACSVSLVRLWQRTHSSVHWMDTVAPYDRGCGPAHAAAVVPGRRSHARRRSRRTVQHVRSRVRDSAQELENSRNWKRGAYVMYVCCSAILIHIRPWVYVTAGFYHPHLLQVRHDCLHGCGL